MVQPIRPQDATGIYRQQIATAAPQEAERAIGAGSRARGSARRTDQVQLSDRARELQRALDAAKAHPEVRDELVEALRTRVDNGQYDIDSTVIARRIAAAALEQRPQA